MPTDEVLHFGWAHAMARDAFTLRSMYPNSKKRYVRKDGPSRMSTAAHPTAPPI
jgi:hypothetical protein